MEDRQEEKKHSFVREKIIEKPLNKKRALIRLLVSALSGLVFAGMACLVFALLLPHLQMTVQVPTEQESVAESGSTQTEDTEPTESATEDEPVVTEEPPTTEEPPSTEEPDTEPDDGTGSAEPEGDGGAENEPVFPEVALTIADYQKLQDELYGIGARANASIVTITSVVSDTDLFNTAYEAEDYGSGVIIAENETEYLVLTEWRVIKNAARISVTFLDDTVCDATLKKNDKNTGLAVLSVDKAGVGGAKEVAVIGNPLTVYGGMIALALGSPLGTNYSILTGSITSTNNEISLEDNNYTVFTTDIVADRDGSGVLINVEGEIIGIVMQEYSASHTENTLTAVSVGELQAVIEKLCAGEDVPYMGIKVSTVTSKIESYYGIPKGVYIKEVTMDSPAMKAGLQSGDVITSIGGTEVRTAAAYAGALMEHDPGEVVTVEVKRKGANDYSAISYQVTIGILQ